MMFPLQGYPTYKGDTWSAGSTLSRPFIVLKCGRPVSEITSLLWVILLQDVALALSIVLRITINLLQSKGLA